LGKIPPFSGGKRQKFPKQNSLKKINANYCHNQARRGYTEMTNYM
jgi:hypothetical protein